MPADRFVSLWDRNLLPSAVSRAREVYDELEALYAQPWRAYHNMDHITDCLDFFDQCSDHALNADAVELAIWFHDCIYNIGDSDNEAKSRDLFLEKAEGQLPPELMAVIDELIMDTRHVEEPESSDGKLLSDIDLTSFSLPWERYLADGKNVQLEMGYTDENDNRDGKIRFLSSLNEHGRIYYSPYYAKHHEHVAQANIRRHLDILHNQ